MMKVMSADYGREPDRGVTVTFHKDCECNATARTNAIRTRCENVGEYKYTMTRTFYPGISCDGCGKAWTLVPNGNASTTLPLLNYRNPEEVEA